MPVVDADVKEIIDTERDTTPFIETAQLIVDEDLADSELSTERLDKIVLYLAAHFVCITEEKGGLKSERLGEASSSYAIPKQLAGYHMTRYGQQAMMLDTTGKLASDSTGRLKALFQVIQQDSWTTEDGLSGQVSD